MAHLIASFLCSLDLRVTDASGRFEWAEPPEEVHAFVNERERPVGTYLYGRRMWETMRFWQTMADEESVMGDYGRLWRAADKVVYSTTLERVDAPQTRIEHRFEPAAVRALKTEAAAPLSIGGAELAGQALRAGLVDRLDLLLAPVIVGEGPRAVPDGLRTTASLLQERRFGAGWVHLSYAVGASV